MRDQPDEYPSLSATIPASPPLTDVLNVSNKAKYPSDCFAQTRLPPISQCQETDCVTQCQPPSLLLVVILAMPPSPSDSSSPFSHHSSVAGSAVGGRTRSRSVSLEIQIASWYNQLVIGRVSVFTYVTVGDIIAETNLPIISPRVLWDSVCRTQLTMRSAVIYLNNIIGSTTSLSQHPSHS